MYITVKEVFIVDIIVLVWVLGRVNIGGHWRPYEIIYDDYVGQ